MADVREVRKEIDRRVKQLLDERTTWDSHWSEIRDFILPDHGYALTGDGSADEDGRKRHSNIIADTATSAVGILAAGLQSGLTNPASPWFGIATIDPGYMSYKPATSWLYQVERVLYHIFSRSNVYNALHHVYRELGGFCTGAMGVMESFRSVIHCRPFTVGEYAIALDHEQKADTFYRESRMTARQIAERFGEENMSSSAKRALKEKPDERFVVSQLVEPNDNRLAIRDALGRPFRSIYFEKDSADEGKLLEVRGYDEFPFMVPRWTTVGNQVYGRGQGMQVLGDVKMLQKLHRESLINIGKINEPPVQAPGEMKNENINSMPGGVSFRAGVNSKIETLYNVPPAIEPLEFKIQQTEDRIRRGMYNDLFLMLAGTPAGREMTAREVAERHEEKLLMLGPVLTRLFDELLDPLIDRTFAIANRAGLIPPPPPELQGMELKVEYKSMLAQAQRMVGSFAIRETAEFAGALAGISPSVIDVLDLDGLVRDEAEIKGLNPQRVRSEKEVAQLRQIRAQQVAMQQQLEQAAQGASITKTLSEASTEGSSVLNTLMGRPSNV